MPAAPMRFRPRHGLTFQDRINRDPSR
jgi:hypothetical protein